MRKILLSFVLLLALTGRSQQTNVIFGNVGNYGLKPAVGATVTATLLAPNPRTCNNILIRVDPVTTYTDTNGYFAFTNFLWGNYLLSVSGQSGTVFKWTVWTNTLGNVAIGSLITNSAVLPPNPNTNYYTQAQVNALFQNYLYPTFDSGNITFDRN